MASEDDVNVEDEISQEEEQEEEYEAGTSRKRSLIWSYFERTGRSKVRCRLCNHEQNYHGTTGNLLRHLKSKHHIDATIKGQTESPKAIKIAENMQRIKSQDGSETSRVEVGHRRFARKVIAYEETDIDPYTTDNGFENYLKLDEEGLEKLEKPKTVEEQRILAEIDYFREKAAYYRMQKNLVALQAKKVKLELDQIG